MKLIILEIQDLKYAFPETISISLTTNIVIEYLTETACIFRSPYGNCGINGHSMKDMIEIVNNDINAFVAILLNNGIKKEQLPIWPKSNIIYA